MTERLGSMVKNRLEEIWVSVREIQGEANVELRVHGRSVSGKEEPLPGREAITLPVGLLPVLLRVLTQAQDVLIKRGLIYTPSPAEAIVVEDGLPITVRMADAAAGRKSRLYPRVSLSVPVECRVIDPDSFWPAKPVNGEAKDVSIGGAQVWLSKPLPRFKQVEVFMVIAGMPFRARAEIAGVELETKKDAKSGYYRHSLRWVTMEVHAKEVLSKVVPGI